jgi:hypothetical protein
MDDLNNALDPTTDWLSFFLMTIGVFQPHIFSSGTFTPSFFSLFFPPQGWFIFLTSLLNLWRVERWERHTLASQRETTVSSGMPLASHPFCPRTCIAS